MRPMTHMTVQLYPPSHNYFLPARTVCARTMYQIRQDCAHASGQTSVSSSSRLQPAAVIATQGDGGAGPQDRCSHERKPWHLQRKVDQ